MKKKVLCLAMAAAMSVGMSTSAFAARVGSGNVDGDNTGVNGLTANDSAMILQYVLDSSFTGDGSYFDLNEANYDGDAAPNGGDLITASDATFILQDVLSESSSVVMDVAVGNTAEFSINVSNSTKVVDIIDDILTNDNYKSEVESNLPALNSTIDGIRFGQNGKTTTIRTDLGWSKFEAALEDVVTDKTAFDALKVGDTRYTSADELKTVLENVKKAIPSGSLTEANVNSTIDKVGEITGSADMATVTVYATAENKVVSETTYSLKEAAQIALNNNFGDYENLTVGDLQNAFGNNFVINAQNPSSASGKTYTGSVKIERRFY